jgi:hypothetical protein
MRKTLGLLVTGALLLTGCGTGPAGSQREHRADRAELTAAPDATVVAVGDIACPPGKRRTAVQCRQGATARAAVALSPDRVIALGDEQYQKGSYYGFTHAYKRSWGKLKSITWPVPGNHEYYTAGARGYYRYFKYRQPGTPGYYRRALNGWQLYLLNSNCGKIDCAAERAWFERQLTANPSTCALMAFHHPRFSSGGEHGSSRAMKPFWDIAYRHGVDIALAGHDHDYERFAPMDPAGNQVSDGIQEFVSGLGGRSLYPRGTTVPGSQKFIDDRFGVLALTLRPNSYSWQFHDTSLAVQDSGTGTCR